MLPPQKPHTGRPGKDHRIILNGILWILRTGCPWRGLPERYGPWKTVSSRFYRWQRAGIWDQVLAEVQRQADAEGRLDWSLHFVDSTVVRAHQHAAGAKGDPAAEVINEVAMSVRGDKVECAVNGTTVWSAAKADVVGDGKLASTDGVTGIRVSHNSDAIVTGFAVGK